MAKNSPSLAVAKNLKFFNADELIEGTGQINVIPAERWQKCKKLVRYVVFLAKFWQ